LACMHTLQADARRSASVARYDRGHACTYARFQSRRTAFGISGPIRSRPRVHVCTLSEPTHSVRHQWPDTIAATRARMHAFRADAQRSASVARYDRGHACAFARSSSRRGASSFGVIAPYANKAAHTIGPRGVRLCRRRPRDVAAGSDLLRIRQSNSLMRALVNVDARSKGGHGCPPRWSSQVSRLLRRAEAMLPASRAVGDSFGINAFGWTPHRHARDRYDYAAWRLSDDAGRIEFE